ncbi:MAG: MBL fold metallo-hydrolase [Streptosporangiales bacterium]|nr:MBL fold metallo-hydrolase [Streptosporangiales bacterium]
MCSTDAAAPVPGFAGTTTQADQTAKLEIPLEPVDSLTVTMLIDNIADLTAPDTGPAARPGLADGTRVDDALFAGGWATGGLVAEHGFSALVTVTKNGADHHLLFDAGLTQHALSTNMGILGVDPGSVETIVLSHGHFDHVSGLSGFVRSVGRVNVPVVIHPEFWTRRRLVIPGKDPVELPTASKRALEETGFTIVEDRQPSFLFDNSVLITGEVDRTTGFEKGFPPQQAWRDGGWEPDPLVLDDQALIVNVRGKGLVVLTGCGHAGIVNITRYARRLTGAEKIHAVMGGFHLGGPMFEPLIPQVCAELKKIAPDVIVPAHCTGWNAQRALAGQFPDAFIPNTVGTRYRL